MSELPVPAPAASLTPSPEGPVRYGRYILIDRLGAGGMAEVFRALAVGAEQFQSVVVVKRILAHLCANPSFIKMFIDEAKLCGQLSHPNVIRVHDFGKQEGQYFLAMEYVQGRNLGPIMRRLGERRELMPPLIAAEIIRQASRGLAYAHSLAAVDGKPLGIIHRDISPGNIMVAYSGVVKVLDFGVARVESRFRKTLTDPGQLKGKAAYLAPEQIASGSFDHRADIFPLGILLHEMLTGRRLFRGVSATESMTLIKTMPIPTPSTINPKIPAALDAIVMRALERAPEARYSHASDLADDLEGLLLESRFSSHELPRFMQTCFEEDSHSERLDLSRDDLQELIRRADKSGAHPAVGPVAAAVETPAALADPEGAAALAMLDQWPEPTLDDADVVVPVPQRKRTFVVLGGMVALAGALALTIATRHSSSAPLSSTHALPGLTARAAPAETAAPRPTAQPPAPSPAAPPVVEAPPGVAPASSSVLITISSEPTGATVYQPGGAAGNAVLGVTPIDLTLARGAQPLSFRIAKPGFVEGLLKVVPDTDKPALVTLAQSTNNASVAGHPAPPHNDRKVRNALPMDPFSK